MNPFFAGLGLDFGLTVLVGFLFGVAMIVVGIIIMSFVEGHAPMNHGVVYHLVDFPMIIMGALLAFVAFMIWIFDIIGEVLSWFLRQFS